MINNLKVTSFAKNVPALRLLSKSIKEYSIEGCISFDTAAVIGEKFLLKIEEILAERIQNFDISIDLSQLDAIDASALALFIDWIRKAKVHNITLNFYNAPQSLVAMARISRLDYLFNKDSESNTSDC